MRNSLLLTLLGLAAITALALYWRSYPTVEPVPDEHEQTMAHAVAAYVPKVPGNLSDLSVDATALLESLPGVVKVERLVAPSKPTSRIVQLCDWHWVEFQLFVADLQTARSRKLSAEEAVRAHEELVWQVARVQVDQEGILRCLVNHHSLKEVFVEGLTYENLPAHILRVKELAPIQLQLAELRGKLAEVQLLMKELRGERREKAKEAEQLVRHMIRDRTLVLIQAGATVRVPGLQALPLDDAKHLEDARPRVVDGRLHLDPERIRERESAMVRAVLERGSFGLVVLGGDHDLTAHIREQWPGCEYLQVWVKSYPK